MTSAVRHRVTLRGCTPTPLASYLKALAVLRLVSEQKDPEARGYWSEDAFVLESSLNEEGLLDFLLREYRPTPVASPWNLGSGFYPKSAKLRKSEQAVESLAASVAPRLDDYREVLDALRDLISGMGGPECVRTAVGSPATKEDTKRSILTQCRNRLPSAAVEWLDAAYLLAGDGPACPPLLGSGGNDGNLEFSSGFMQRLCDVLRLDDPNGGATAQAGGWLAMAMHAGAMPGLSKDSIGQFAPGGAGGANATTGYDGESLVNPWDYVLMIEGALLFAASTSRRLGSSGPGQLAFPFTVRSSGAGHGSLSTADPSSSRNETWLPLWERPCSLAELKMLLSEGRAQVSRRVAIDGVDFARAVARLGVDRGITAFERVGYLQRNGLAYLAVPIGRWEVVPRPAVELLDQVDGWLGSFERAANGDRAPASFVRAHHAIERAIMGVCRGSTAERWQQLLIALGAAEEAMVRSPKSTLKAGLRPLRGLAWDWLTQVDDDSAELRLACALASMIGPSPIGPLRANMAPMTVRRDGRAWDFAEKMQSKGAVWGKGDLTSSLLAVLQRRCLDARRANLDSLPLDAVRPAPLGDVARFIAGDLDEEKIESLLWGLNAVEWGSRVDSRPPPPRIKPLTQLLPAGYALLKLTHLPWPAPLPWSTRPVPVRYDPEGLTLAAAGRMEAATAVAYRRLRASGLTALVSRAPADPALSRRIAAAVLFPISRLSAARLGDTIIVPPRED
ncbi:MAG: type I-U CRISPR-associated protein Csx17 [Armatimonadia bacterium]|nr:type I-U CRISPR-associated protein Csx17 [Armatimonadia bacterium]